MPSTTITGGVAVVPPGWLGAIAVSLTLAIAMAALVLVRQRIFQTTLAAGWWWMLAATGSWAVVEVVGSCVAPAASRAWLEPLRLAAVALSFCPVVALVGAKRPQHNAWNFVVLSLWVIVVLPAAEAFWLRRGQPIDMGDARGWFLWALILLTPINYVPTRFWPAALLTCAGQTVALAPHLPCLRRALLPEMVGCVLCGGGIIAAWALSMRASRARHPHDALWLDFRDSFGLLWGLRLQERVNAVAGQCGWNIELAWTGYREHAGGVPPANLEPAVESALRTTVTGLMRRFVSPAWIASRAAAAPTSVRPAL